jgi:hypothetical protein
MLTTLPCREAPTEKLPVTQLPDTRDLDQLAADLRSCAARLQAVRLHGREDAVSAILEIADAVEHAS